jgi:hypothetical protein
MPRTQEPRAKLILPLAALIAILPLIRHGYSCGHDFDFHIVNWIEAAHQFLHGNPHPTWAYTPAYNAGEPRFTFYPPISWTIGALLGLILPWTWTPIAYTWLALTAAGASLYYLAKTYTTPNAALIAATFYIANPYMLFTAYERTAYAELLAAAFIPLLLQAILREQITIPRIAIPIALLWLTNAPAAVMASYTIALLTLIRIATTTGAPSFAHSAKGGVSRESATALTRLNIALTTTLATALALALAAIYILPAAYERRYVQITMAIIPGLHPQDNFLFHRTGTTPDQLLHDTVLHTASIVAIILITLTAAVLLITYRRATTQRRLLLPLTILTLLITLLLTPISAPIWQHLPELRFLQFPWRFLAILAPALSLTIALALTPLNLSPTRTTLTAVATAALLTAPAYTAFHQPCDDEDTIPARLALSQTQGSEPTDEYTPTTADNDSLKPNNPPYWLSPDDPNEPAPTDSRPGPTPAHFSFRATQPGFLILNLRDYPSWDITSTDPSSMHLNHPEHIRRDDGLIALPLYYASNYTIDIAHHRLPDETLALIISALALIILILITRRKPHTPSADIIKT